MPLRQQRPFDVVLFGATSFVGQITARHLVARHGTEGPFRWAIAGRSRDKLAEVADATGADVEQLVVDAADPAALARLAESTRVLATTVGPYARYGSPVVAAAVDAGTDYCDLTGEAHWVRAMIDQYQGKADASGARIVPSAGFDCIPSDLGVWFTQQRAKELHGEWCSSVSMRVRRMQGGVSGGTVASMLELVEAASKDKDLRRLLADPYALNPDDLRSGPRQPDTVRPTRDATTGRWLAPFVMASVNTRVVQRTHALLGRPWGPGFTYDEAMDTGAGPLGLAKAAAVAGGMGAGMGLVALGPTRKLVRNVVPKPGTGPSPEAQEAGGFDLRFFGRTPSGKTIETKVTGDRDPGYGCTAKMFGETAAALSALGDEVPGGFWTTATALGDALVERLEAHAGLRFEVLDS